MIVTQFLSLKLQNCWNFSTLAKSSVVLSNSHDRKIYIISGLVCLLQPFVQQNDPLHFMTWAQVFGCAAHNDHLAVFEGLAHFKKYISYSLLIAGTYTVRDPVKNSKVKIAKVIRETHNEELARQIRTHLQENAFEHIPCRSTILKIISCMPARSSKAMAG